MEGVTFDTIVSFINTTGFPIAVAVYTLVRLEKTVKVNTRVMERIAVKLGVGFNE